MAQLPPPDEDRFYTVMDGPEVEIKRKGSVFRAQLLPAADSEAMQAALGAIRAQYHDATHHCSASRLEGPGGPERADDDGEPNRSAGLPILQQLQRAELWRCLLVVTRWYGGTKLGTGGLVRAYGDAAREAVEATTRQQLVHVSALEFDCSFEQIGAVEAFLAQRADRLRGVKRSYEPRAHFRLHVVRSHAEILRDELFEALAGQLQIKIQELGAN